MLWQHLCVQKLNHRGDLMTDRLGSSVLEEVEHPGKSQSGPQATSKTDTACHSWSHNLSESCAIWESKACVRSDCG